MAHEIELVAGSGPRIQRVVRTIAEPFREAVAVCRSRLHANAVAVHVVDAPDGVIPEWGLGGYTYGPHSVLIAVDADHALEPVDVISTLVHEIHHAMRWRSQGAGSSLRERLVAEGLAQVFECEVTGRTPLYAQGSVTQEQRDAASQHLDETPADEGRWFFGSSDLPRWFGYGLGYETVRTALETLGSDAASTVGEPSATFERWLR
jgi:hypothetical protein